MNNTLPPEVGRDPTPLEEAVLEQLEAFDVPTDVCDAIMALLDKYQIEAFPVVEQQLPDPLDQGDNLGESPDY